MIINGATALFVCLRGCMGGGVIAWRDIVCTVSFHFFALSLSLSPTTTTMISTGARYFLSFGVCGAGNLGRMPAAANCQIIRQDYIARTRVVEFVCVYVCDYVCVWVGVGCVDEVAGWVFHASANEIIDKFASLQFNVFFSTPSSSYTITHSRARSLPERQRKFLISFTAIGGKMCKKRLLFHSNHTRRRSKKWKIPNTKEEQLSGFHNSFPYFLGNNCEWWIILLQFKNNH